MATLAQGAGTPAGLGLAAPRMRPSTLRALGGLSLSIVLRLLREGLVVRALAWPGLLTALSMFISASVTIAWRNNPVIYVSEAAVVEPLRDDGFKVTLTDDAEQAVREGRVERGVWREGDRLVLGATWGGALTAQAEAVLRRLTGERWRLEIPDPPKRSRDSAELRPVTGVLAGVVGLLFTLYGVVIGAGSLYRDRASGVLESDLALPVPRWLHAASRLVALSAVLAPALVVSLLVVDSLLPIHDLWLWAATGFFASLFGGTLGVALMARADGRRGFSGPLSQALTGSMALISLGFWKPAIGHYLPLLSLGSAFRGVEPSPLVPLAAIAIAVVVARDFQRRECV